MKTLYKFEAEWCGPCHAIRPAVAQIVKEYNLDLQVINIDEDAEAANVFEVRTIPALILYEDGVPIGRHIGSAPASVIIKNLGL
jgi:thioredoxin 1